MEKQILTYLLGQISKIVRKIVLISLISQQLWLLAGIADFGRSLKMFEQEEIPIFPII